jgi:hypothetical protein
MPRRHIFESIKAVSEIPGQMRPIGLSPVAEEPLIMLIFHIAYTKV